MSLPERMTLLDNDLAAVEAVISGFSRVAQAA